MSSEVDAVYRRTLRLLVAVAAELEQPTHRLSGGHTVGEGSYYELEGVSNVSSEDVKKISDRIDSLVADGADIEKVTLPWKDVHSYAEERGLSCMKSLLETRVTAEVSCHRIGKVLRLAFGPVHERAAGLKASKYSIIKPTGAPGFIAAYAKGDFVVQQALLNAHIDHISWGRTHGVSSVGALNSLQQVGRSRKDYVLQCEFRQEAKLAAIASEIKTRQTEGKPVRLICIAGPTSSGKTTFSNKLCMYLQGHGFDAKPLTVDHYYLPLDRQPKYQARKQRIDVDYDHIESMDVELVGKHLNDLVNGKSVMTPIYNMKTGYRDGEGHHFDALPDNGILVIEGIHALNPSYTQTVQASKVYKIYISPLTALQVDDGNPVKTTNHRLLRRMCRDYLFRGNSASVTLKMWDNVRKGEGLWIFPHQNNVDCVMNSAADYEIPVLKTFLEPLLKAVRPDDENYSKAMELLQLLDRFCTWPPDLTTGSALLREFIGGGVFDCH
jgi:uridine kinase